MTVERSDAMPTVTVEFEKYRYPVHIGAGVLDMLVHELAGSGARSAAVLTDDIVGPLYGAGVESAVKEAGLSVKTITVPAGESAKSLERLSKIYSGLLAMDLTRSDRIIALGGGVVGDLAGFAAATFLRGVPYIQLPTTLLAQVDSSVGGKTAVNLPQGKNLVGAFYNPELVLADTATLRTLDDRQLRAGMAEVLKYGAICDEDLFTLLEGGMEAALGHIDELVFRCCGHKAGYVRRDPNDKGCRMELNFGHTFGHAVENVGGYGKYLHGEGVAVGMVEAARWGELLGISPDGTAKRIRKALKGLDLPVEVPDQLRLSCAEAMTHDKKSTGGTIRLVLLEKIGKAVIYPMKKEELFRMVTEGRA